MKKARILCLVLVLAMCVAVFAACTGDGNDTSSGASGDNSATSDTSSDVEPPKPEYSSVADQTRPIFSTDVYGEDYIDQYTYLTSKDHLGLDLTIDMVKEDSATGLAYIVIDDVRYDLGEDTLTMAMVYNTKVPEGGRWQTEDDVYATWWKYYITRWNYLLPEIPLYSNEYYDVYNAQIKGVVEHPTNPYWGTAKALIDWSSEKADNSIILGNSTALSGRFRASSWGVSSPGAADLDIENLITGLETAVSTKDGDYVVNNTVVKNMTEKDNDDGTHTYTIQIHDDLQFSDGSKITAKNYIVYTLAASTKVAAQAGGTGRAGMTFTGFDAFNAYDGTNDGTDGASKAFSGVRLIDEYTFEVTVDTDFYPYYYAITYAAFAPYPLAQWIGDADVVDDGNGAYLTDTFYAKNGETYTVADQIKENVQDTSSKFAFSGPYMIESYDEASQSAVLVKNPKFKGNYEGVTPKIERVVYKRIVSATQLDDLKSGGVDVLSNVTGGDATDEALALLEEQPDNFVATHYARAGYGKLGFRNDLGPVRFLEVRQAIAYCLDRATFAKDFTGGYGGVVDGPYYTGAWQYKAAVADGMLLNQYPTSVDSAKKVLEEGGWIYNADGSEYTDGAVRYKKLAANEIDEKEITYASKDGAYKVEKVGDYYYMPLVINWYGTSDNDFSDLLVTGFMEADKVKACGIAVQNTLGEFATMLDELYQGAYGAGYGGVPTYNAFNFATGFTSAIYDYSWNWTIDHDMFDDYQQFYMMDSADAIWLK